jgi:hypothetical protein
VNDQAIQTAHPDFVYTKKGMNRKGSLWAFSEFGVQRHPNWISAILLSCERRVNDAKVGFVSGRITCVVGLSPIYSILIATDSSKSHMNEPRM